MMANDGIRTEAMSEETQRVRSGYVTKELYGAVGSDEALRSGKGDGQQSPDKGRRGRHQVS